MKILAIDYGEAKVGLAIGDDESGLGLPLKIIKNHSWNELINQLKKIIIMEKIETIIIGLPINYVAKSSQQIERIKQFIDFLKTKIDCPIITVDESFSSRAAQKIKPHGDDDAVAAMIILQDYLDQKKK